MARKLKPHEERAFAEAAPSAGFAFGTEGGQARHFYKATDHHLFDQKPPGPGHIDLLVDEELGQDDWF